MPPEHGVVSSNLTGRATFKWVRPGDMGDTTFNRATPAISGLESWLPIPAIEPAAVRASYATRACEKARYSSSDCAGSNTQSV